ncbi:uncharacterized protein B0H18DRAFT_929566 [Fomitopsis serialis]|uniref:uncharacterized protein n=1 Tax=Fomitopsis serialis TaxID=139415 RepID=UPI0020085298|nr:uncharacterized protein B0H18DRAFT_929566 [Neoantrodia serialis]KAH9931523.1 hypothetical protein B0H18DRAFT_929566 [Neoantrodia serialis]
MPRKVKSSLVDHHFPRFYACYLLKSIRTARATATYIGSTPSPPRRIRQHNGEITQGAWKTKHNRPWIMQMIVYGFPSKLTALQFEWAWQHPHISRHLRGEDGKAVFQNNSKSRYLKTNVSIARSMICSHPYNTWPLRVKLFTAEAEKAWSDAARDADDLALPQGFSYTVELEGVDGKSGKAGTGRTGPIDVNDVAFTSDHLRKWTTVLASPRPLLCSVCNEALDRQIIDPMTTALCPSPNCTTVSHLSCLCSDFLEHERSTDATPGRLAMIPRGGECRSCRTYILWGDVIRGCYRRRGDDAPQPESDGMEDEEAQSLEDAEIVLPPTRQPSKKALGKTASRRRGGAAPRKRPAALLEEGLSEGEFFDLNNVSGSSEDDSAGGEPLVVASVQRTTTASRTAVGRGNTPENNRPEEAAPVPSSSTRQNPTRSHPEKSTKVSRGARRDVQAPRQQEPQSHGVPHPTSPPMFRQRRSMPRLPNPRCPWPRNTAKTLAQGHRPRMSR